MQILSTYANTRLTTDGLVHVSSNRNGLNSFIFTQYSVLHTSIAGSYAANLESLLATAKILSTEEIEGNTKDFMRWLDTP